jgi:two-component system phosphate regulon sensor histidine kinase PhoR
MLLFDLQWLLFGFLLLLVAAMAAAIWLDRRWRREREAVFLDPERGRAVLERAPFGLLVLDGPRACRYANSYACRLLELASPPCWLPETAWVHLLNEDRVAARLEAGIEGRYRSVSLPSDQVVRWWVAPWGDLDLVFLLDVTAQQRAEQAARLLLSDLSHELRTPLATILTHLQVLLLPDISTEIGQQSLRLLKEEAQRMARLVNDMLELGRLETSAEIERRPVELLTVVEEAIVQIAPQAEEREIALSLEADAPLPLVLGDADRLKQVFLNLLDNAVKYSRPGDRAVVSLRRVREGIACAVCDTGPGIPAEHLPHVTRRFYRAVPQGEGGSGLGLALVKEILRRHQSRLEIESHTEGEERGTCVRFVLPVLPEEEAKR